MAKPPPQDPTSVLWERLRAAEPAEVAQRAAVRWEPDAQAYAVPLLDADFRVAPAERRVEGPDGKAGFEAMLCCVQYLLTSRDEPPAGEWVGPLSLPYGDLFFRGLHEMPTAKLESCFGERLDLFRAAGAALDGRPVEIADAACQFDALPRVPVIVALWAADDEFAARAQFLLDKRADRQLPLDALWLLCDILARRLVGADTGH